MLVITPHWPGDVSEVLGHHPSDRPLVVRHVRKQHLLEIVYYDCGTLSAATHCNKLKVMVPIGKADQRDGYAFAAIRGPLTNSPSQTIAQRNDTLAVGRP